VNQNLATYSRTDVVEHYATFNGLLPPEKHVLSKYLSANKDIFDIGVGGGRTTPYLMNGAKSYIGADYSTEMVVACQKRYPSSNFVVADATDLSQFLDHSFDFIIFSFNGIDTIIDDQKRIQALCELRRVMREDGILVISSHNARNLVHHPRLSGLSLFNKVSKIGQSLAHNTLPRAASLLRSGAFFRGQGNIKDPAHGGLIVYVSTPATIAAAAAAAGLKVIDIVSAFHPRRIPDIMNPWHTYVLKRNR
jgi:ubiquinone/menaquinone biosynthesis C-methylase UbiE